MVNWIPNKKALAMLTLATILLSFFVIHLNQTNKEATKPHHITSPGELKMSKDLKIEIYSKKHCPYCVKAKDLFVRKGVAFEEIDLDKHPELIPAMIERTKRKTVPQIFINQKHIGGCDDLYKLEEEGLLDSYLVSK